MYKFHCMYDIHQVQCSKEDPTIFSFENFLTKLNFFQFSLIDFRVNITYIDKNGKSIPIQGKVGDNVMYLAHRHNIEMEGKLLFGLYCFSKY